MTNCTGKLFEFPVCKRRKVEAAFEGGAVTSDAGVLLLRQIDRRLGLTQAVARCLKDGRDPSKVIHTTQDLVRQRIFGLALGYEDLNDHLTLRDDPGFQTGVDRDRRLASSSTLCRWENQADREIFWSLHNLLVDQFIASQVQTPGKLVLDFDATDDPVHGKQEKRFFHGYYDSYCYLPLYVFCGDQPLVAYLRPANIDAAKHAGAMLSWLVRRLRRAWPEVEIIFRGDSGFCRHVLLSWCERHNIKYIVGLAKNSRLVKISEPILDQAAIQYEASHIKQRMFWDFQYGAASWKCQRRVILREEHTSKGSNPRFVVTNLEGSGQELYEKLYCARGEMENRIKEQQLCLFADRTSCHDWWANQFRLFMSTLAYMLLESLRRIGLQGTALAKARCDTIRIKFMKIGAVILRNTRRIRFLLSEGYPHQEQFALLYARLQPG
ncbi:MAG: IS1380 family transposase [Magnetococcales bacterium]|nr:IS1380 family transposase [Magnetococcales bacterium]